MTFSKTFPLFSLLLFALVFASGCATHVVDTGYLEGGYESFNIHDEPEVKIRLDEDFLNRVYTREDFPNTEFEDYYRNVAMRDVPTTRSTVFVVPEPTWLIEDPYPDEPARSESIIFTIRERIYRYLLRSYPHPTRVRYAFRRSELATLGSRVITITANVTDHKKGNGFLRYFVGWSLGKSKIQIEGEIFEGPNREHKIGEYAIRKGHAAYAQNGWNVAVIDSCYCTRYAVEEAILDFTQALPLGIEGIILLEPEGPDTDNLAALETSQ